MVENPKFFVNVRFSFFDDRGTWYSVGSVRSGFLHIFILGSGLGLVLGKTGVLALFILDMSRFILKCV